MRKERILRINFVPYVYSGTYSLEIIPELNTHESRTHVINGDDGPPPVMGTTVTLFPTGGTGTLSFSPSCTCLHFPRGYTGGSVLRRMTCQNTA